MRIYFVNLSWHQNSKSCKWFTDLLRTFAEVCEVAFDYNNQKIYDIIEAKPDLVICWQTEFLTPLFYSQGIPAISIPMADGCANFGNFYYKVCGFIGSISTSDFIYYRFLKSNCYTYRLKYYPSKNDFFNYELDSSNGKREIEFFGSYRSKIHQESNTLNKFIRDNFSGEFNYHLASDEYFAINNPYEAFDTNYFNDIKELDKLLINSNYFIAPRNSEGIGLSIIRAMLLGCIPIGVDGAGNNEYFLNKKLGITVPMRFLKKRPNLNESIFLKEYIKSKLDQYTCEERRQFIEADFKTKRGEYLLASEGLEIYINKILNRFEINKKDLRFKINTKLMYFIFTQYTNFGFLSKFI